MIFSYTLIFIAVFFASAGQIMLKIGSREQGIDFKLVKINLWIITGLVAIIISLLLNVRALRLVPLKDMAFILPTVYILVPIFSRMFLKEKFGKNMIIGTMILLLGIVLFNIPLMQLF